MRKLLLILLLVLSGFVKGQTIIDNSWNNDTVPAGTLVWIDVDFNNLSSGFVLTMDSVIISVGNQANSSAPNASVIFRESGGYINAQTKYYNPKSGDTTIRLYLAIPSTFVPGKFGINILMQTNYGLTVQGAANYNNAYGYFSAAATTGITTAQQPTVKTVIARYNFMGEPIMQPQGIYIECYSDGTREKKGIVNY